jgi:hypothetical protein
MARRIPDRDISPILTAGEQWIKTCLIEDRSVLSQASLWTQALVKEVSEAFVGHPDFGSADFMTKLKGQMKNASPEAQRLMAEMLWALLLFPSNMKARTKRQQIREIWALCGRELPENLALLADNVLVGIGSGGPGFNNYRPEELAFLIALVSDVKERATSDRRKIFSDYDAFTTWVESVGREGSRQYRHMLRYFAFPDRVERISSNNDRRKILEAFDIAPIRESRRWTDRQLDDALLKLRAELEKDSPAQALDFYQPDLKGRWAPDRHVKTIEGEVTVVVPSDEDEEEDKESGAIEPKPTDTRQSIQVQAKLAEIGIIMGFKIWTPRGDRARIRELLPVNTHHAFLEELPLNYDETTLDTIEQIDVLWLARRSIVRAFEVEHTTAVYSGLLRMADLLALQPNMAIKLHIVAPDERRNKVFREMLRPVFSLLDRGPLSESCTFISYESVDAIRNLEHLAHTNDTLLKEYEEKAEVA